MKRVLVLGAGMVSGPCVRHLLEDPDVEVTVADLDGARAKETAGGHERARAVRMDAAELTTAWVENADVVVSLLPASLNPAVAGVCVQARTDLIAPSTVAAPGGEDELDQKAREAGLLVLAEMGLDPGIDHMLAAETIDAVNARGGTVTGFYSWCGGLPAPEANTNPFDYKFSWYPEGALMASARPAVHLRDGKRISIDGRDLLNNYSLKYIDGAGWFEEYPNGDSTRYLEGYGIPDARTIYRATLRYPGWCETAAKLVEMGLTDDRVMDASVSTYRDLTAWLTGCPGGRDLEAHVADHLGLSPYSAVMKRIGWLGLLGERPVPAGVRTAGEAIRRLMAEMLVYDEGERDMVVMRHEFDVLYPDTGRREGLASTLVDYGVPGGDSAMARGTGLPPAIAARLVMDGKIDLVGLRLPVEREIYGPVLELLKASGYRLEGGRDA